MPAGDESGTLVVAFLDEAGTEVVVSRMDVDAVDLALVDALARLHLEACRAGCSMQVRNPCPELDDLLELVGLSGLIGAPTDAEA